MRTCMCVKGVQSGLPIWGLYGLDVGSIWVPSGPHESISGLGPGEPDGAHMDWTWVTCGPLVEYQGSV